MNILYVASHKSYEDMMCPGSIVCLSLAEKIPDEMIQIQNCDVLRTKTDLPDWLNGTPILINERDQVPYRGQYAIRQLKKIVEALPKSQIKTNQSIVEINKDEEDNDPFKMDVQPNLEEVKSDKVTEQDLQKYMEQRNASVASQQPKQSQ